jgi:hypothetical protein
LTSDELRVTGRNTADDIDMSRHSAREPSPQQETQARSDDSRTALIKAILGSRDEQEMQSRRDDTSALLKAILGSRDEQEMQSRSDDTSALLKAILGSRDEQEMQSRSDDSTSSLIEALLNSRDLSRRLTTDEMLKILASRAMDDLD